MGLKFKRNYFLILLLLAILCFLTLAIGDQPIIAYTVKAEYQKTGQVATMDVTRPVGLSTPQTAGADSQIAHANAASDIDTKVGEGR